MTREMNPELSQSKCIHLKQKKKIFKKLNFLRNQYFENEKVLL